MINNGFRISGLASGIDTESMIKKLISAESVRMNKIIQQKQWQEWKQETYRETNRTLLKLRTTVEELRLQKTFQKSTVKSSDETKITASINGMPSRNEFTVTDAKLFVSGNPNSIKFGAIALADNKTTVGDGNGFSFSVNGEAVVVSSTDTLDSTISKINALKDKTGVTASYSTGDNALVLTSSDVNTSIEISNLSNTNNVFNIEAGVVSETVNDFNGGNTLTTGYSGTKDTNGQININGTMLTLNNNTFTFDGMEYTLKADIPKNTTVSVKKEVDTEAVFEKIKTFVETYNETIEGLNQTLKEKRYRDYMPLLDEQKSDMKDKDIEMWNEKAKSGILRNDTLLFNGLSHLRQALSENVSGANAMFDTLSEIGITTSTNYRENGKLIIDEERLKSAIKTNLDDVEGLFTTKENGVAWKAYDKLNHTITQVTKKISATGVIEKQMQQYDRQIDVWKERLAKKESYYWKQFTAMEKAIQRSNTQSGWLMQQMGGM